VLESPGASMLLGALADRGLRGRLIEVGRSGLTGAARRMRGWMRSEGIELVHSHGYRSDVLAALVSIGGPVLRMATCHTWYSTTFRLRLYEWIDKLVLRLFHHAVVVSPQLYEELLRAGIDRERITLIYNGVEVDGEVAGAGGLRERYGIGAESRLLLRVGRLAYDKGNSTLLDAFASSFRGRDVVLLFVGEGEEHTSLQEQAARLGIGTQVIFAGYQRNVGEFLRAADLLVISSYSEGLPLVLLEGMAFGKPIVATTAGAIGDVIEHRVEGWLVPPRDAAALAHALEVVMDDISLAERLGSAARECYLEKHTVASMGRCYHTIYRSLLQQVQPS
ncbi:MAG TPA: glycosyltransferase family 1 protein, partial [Gammaproteobacteria bacterium]|nr:glycosyltransferase family 1 protein [Gammaproteobacteria bacterium]